jgi:RND family efflux transporter MFP subunit
VRTNAVSQQEVTRARAERDQAAAALMAARSALIQARIELEYTSVDSPITGVIGRNLVDPGNLVGQGDATLLAEVARIDPIHVYFELPERLVARYLDQREGLRPEDDRDDDDKVPVLVHLDGSDRVYEGQIDYIHLEADSGTGTVEVRALIPNPEKRLLPGFFVRVEVPREPEPGALLVRETALSADLGGRYLLIVGDDNVVERRYAQLGALQDDGMRVIREGISAGEKHIIEGVQRARPGMPVTPKDAPPQGAAPAAATGNAD